MSTIIPEFKMSLGPWVPFQKSQRKKTKRVSYPGRAKPWDPGPPQGRGAVGPQVLVRHPASLSSAGGGLSLSSGVVRAWKLSVTPGSQAKSTCKDGVSTPHWTGLPHSSAWTPQPPLPERRRRLLGSSQFITSSRRTRHSPWRAALAITEIEAVLELLRGTEPPTRIVLSPIPGEARGHSVIRDSTRC